MTPLEKARETMDKLREQGIAVRRKSPLERLAEEPKSLRRAITAFCYQCMGGDADQGVRGSIRACSSTSCPLWDVRPYSKTQRHGDGHGA